MSESRIQVSGCLNQNKKARFRIHKKSHGAAIVKNLFPHWRKQIYNFFNLVLILFLFCLQNIFGDVDPQYFDEEILPLLQNRIPGEKASVKVYFVCYLTYGIQISVAEPTLWLFQNTGLPILAAAPATAAILKFCITNLITWRMSYR